MSPSDRQAGSSKHQNFLASTTNHQRNNTGQERKHWAGQSRDWIDCLIKDDGNVVSSVKTLMLIPLPCLYLVSTVFNLWFSPRKKLGHHFLCLVTPGLVTTWTLPVEPLTIISYLLKQTFFRSVSFIFQNNFLRHILFPWNRIQHRWGCEIFLSEIRQSVLTAQLRA